MRTTIFLLITAVSLAHADPVAEYVGYAYALDSDELVYTETHREVTTENGRVLLSTTYADPAGRPFATREVHFQGMDPVPDFELTDTRIGYTEGVKETEAGLVVYKREGDDEVRKSLEPGKHPVVVDAGFDRFVQQQWDALQAGHFARFEFANCERLALIALRLSRVASRETQYGPVTDFQMEPNNWLVRMLVDPILISYRDEDRSLLEYRGLSNIKRADGENHVVRIFFPPDERISGDGLAAMESAR